MKTKRWTQLELGLVWAFANKSSRSKKAQSRYKARWMSAQLSQFTYKWSQSCSKSSPLSLMKNLLTSSQNVKALCIRSPFLQIEVFKARKSQFWKKKRVYPLLYKRNRGALLQTMNNFSSICSSSSLLSRAYRFPQLRMALTPSNSSALPSEKIMTPLSWSFLT